MKKEIFIHIGTHKTGTSSIQETLIKRSKEIRKEGVKYINLYHFEDAQKIMLLENDDKVIRERLKLFFDSQIENNIEKYIVCCEYLSGNPKKLYSNVSIVAQLIHESVSSFETKRIFVVLRKQEQFIQSIYTQYLHQGEDVSMKTFLNESLLENIKWYNFLQAYESIFGSENIYPVPYDRKVLENINLINFFGKFSNIEFLKNINLDSSNLGYNKEAIEIAKTCNPYLNTSEKKILRSIMQKHLNKKVFSRYTLLDNNEVEFLNNYFNEDNEKLFREYFNDFEIGMYSDIEEKQDSVEKVNGDNYVKIVTLLLRELDGLSQIKPSKTYSSDTKLFKNIVSIPKRVAKKGLKIITRKSASLYDENIELRKSFKNYKQAVILGSASSINRLKVDEFSKDFVITVGNFFEHPEILKIKPKVHIFAASHPPITKEVSIEWWQRCNESLPEETVLLVEKRDKEIAEIVFENRKVYYYSYGGELPVDFTKPIMSPWSVTIVALQLAIYCQIKTIGIIGVNHDWQCIKPYTHFYDHKKPSLEYYLNKAGIEIAYEIQKQPFPKERLYREYGLYQQYETLKSEAQRLNLEIFNFDPFSDFDVFEFKKKTDLIIENNNNND